MKLNVSRETFRNLVCLNIIVPSIVWSKKQSVVLVIVLIVNCFFVIYMQLFKGDLFKDWVVNNRLCLFGFGIYSEQIVVCTWQTYEENVEKK